MNKTEQDRRLAKFPKRVTKEELHQWLREGIMHAWQRLEIDEALVLTKLVTGEEHAIPPSKKCNDSISAADALRQDTKGR